MTAGNGPTGSTDHPALTAAEIAVIIGGTVLGDGDRRVNGVAPLDRAGPGQLSFLADKRYAGLLTSSQAGIVLLAPEFAGVECAAPARVSVDRPYDALISLLPKFYSAPDRPSGVHRSAAIGEGVHIGAGAAIEAGAVIGDGARIGDRAWIGPQCVLEPGVVIEDDARLVAHVTCYRGTVVGRRAIVHAGVRLGSDGFGYVFADGVHRKIPHVGGCVVGDDVEIGANSCIDRGSLDDTTIGAGTKIDNLVHIGHNVQMGRLCLVMAQVGIAGSVHIGDGAIIAGQAGINGHVTIGAAARIGGQAGVFSDVPPGETWSGYPARPHKDALRASAALFRLSGMLRRIERFLDKHE